MLIPLSELPAQHNVPPVRMGSRRRSGETPKPSVAPENWERAPTQQGDSTDPTSSQVVALAWVGPKQLVFDEKIREGGRLQTAVCSWARPSAAAGMPEAGSPAGTSAEQPCPATGQGPWVSGSSLGSFNRTQGAKFRFDDRPARRGSSHTPMALRDLVGEAESSISLATSFYLGFAPQHVKCFGMKTDI